MKLGYYHYFFVQRGRPERVFQDLAPVLRAYVAFDDNDWKHRVAAEEDHKLLLIPTAQPSVFMFVGTRNDELIKAVHTRTMTCEDISERLNEGEETGFAAYISLRQKLLAVASTLKGPKTATFGRFITKILAELLGASWAGWRFELVPIPSQITPDQARGLEFVSRTTVRVPVGTTLCSEILEFVGSPSDAVGSVEIVITAKRRRNLRAVADALLARADRETVDKLVLRAREQLDDDLTDYFVATSGHLADDVGLGSESALLQTIVSRFANNPQLPHRLSEVLSVATYDDSRQVEGLSDLRNARAWRDRVRANSRLRSAEGSGVDREGS
jgi:hypothetical protein